MKEVWEAISLDSVPSNRLDVAGENMVTTWKHTARDVGVLFLIALFIYLMVLWLWSFLSLGTLMGLGYVGLSYHRKQLKRHIE